VNVTLQASPRAKKFTVHIDKVKPYIGDTPKSWLRSEQIDYRPEVVNVDSRRDESDAKLTVEDEVEKAEDGDGVNNAPVPREGSTKRIY